MYVCTYVCTYAHVLRVHIYIYAYVEICINIYMYTCMYASCDMHMYTCVHAMRPSMICNGNVSTLVHVVVVCGNACEQTCLCVQCKCHHCVHVCSNDGRHGCHGFDARAALLTCNHQRQCATEQTQKAHHGVPVSHVYTQQNTRHRNIQQNTQHRVQQTHKHTTQNATDTHIHKGRSLACVIQHMWVGECTPR